MTRGGDGVPTLERTLSDGGGSVVKDDLDHMGPIDYLVIEFPGDKLTGEGMPLLLDLVDRRIIRILDLLYVQKLADGSVVSLTVRESDHLAPFDGASSGILGIDDLDDLGQVLTAGSSAVVLVYENVWAAPLGMALRRAGGQLVAGGRIPVQALLAALDATEPAGAGRTGRG
jgi:hypothetical protein